MPELGVDSGGGTDLTNQVRALPPDVSGFGDDSTVPVGSTQPTPSLQERLAATQKQNMLANGRIYNEQEATLDDDQFRLKQMYERAHQQDGAGPEALKPWNAEAESAKFRTDPIEAFASLGSVFGILASAFTKAPMENALNASAAAMNAVKAGDDRAYERAHGAWKENNDLIVKRHNMMREAYQDAASLMTQDMAAGRAKLQIQAARFGDQKTMALLDAGLDKEVFDLMQSRQKTIIGASQATEEITKSDLQKRAFSQAQKTNAENFQNPIAQAAYDLRDFNRIYGVKDTAEQQAIGELYASKQAEGKRPTPEELAALHDSFVRRYDPAADAIATEEARRAANNLPAMTGDEKIEMARRLKPGTAGGNTTLTPDRARTADVNEIMKKYKLDNPEATPEELAKKRADTERELKTQSQGLTPKLRDDLSGKLDRIGYMEDTIGKVEALMKKHNAITGLGGKVTRPAEVIGNILGSNETDRNQFERYIAELKEWAPRALTDSNSRPLSAEAANISKIVAGLNLGDTAANTERAYREMRQLLVKMRGNLETRLKGSQAPAGSSVPASPAGPKPWERDKKVEAEPVEETA